MLFAEGPTACPFVALENDRDRRSDEPDHRHRCYAVPVPEPRAMAHQRTYCLSAQFPGCPIFQDWAVRAAARPVPLGPAPGPLPPEEPEQIGAWAAPPPWERPATGPTGEPEAADSAAVPGKPAAVPGKPAAVPPEPDEPSAPAQLAAFDGAPKPTGQPEIERLPSLPLDAPAADHSLADAVADGADSPAPATPADRSAKAASASGRASSSQPPIGRFDSAAERLQSPAHPSEARDEPATRRSWDGRDAERAIGTPAGRERQAASRDRQAASRDKSTLRREDVVPPWQRTRYDAYPSLGRRLDLGGGGGGWLSRITTLFAVLAILGLVVALIILAPGLLGLAGPGSSATPIGAVSPSPSGPTDAPSPAVSPSPTPLAHETWQVYVIEAGDSICRIASLFGISYAQLMGANPEITNPAFIRAGDQIDIPPDDFVAPSPAPGATPLGNPCG